jgi:hypothetical protein
VVQPCSRCARTSGGNPRPFRACAEGHLCGSHSSPTRRPARDCIGDRPLVPRPIRSVATPHGWIVAIGVVRSESPQIVKAIVDEIRAYVQLGEVRVTREDALARSRPWLSRRWRASQHEPQRAAGLRLMQQSGRSYCYAPRAGTPPCSCLWAIAQVRGPRRRAAADCCFQRWCLQPNTVAASDLTVSAVRALRGSRRHGRDARRGPRAGFLELLGRCAATDAQVGVERATGGA